MHFVGQIVKVHIFYNEFAMLSKFLMFSVISETYCIKLALMFFSSIETMIQRIHEKSLRGNFNSAATVVCIFYIFKNRNALYYNAVIKYHRICKICLNYHNLNLLWKK